MNSKGNGTGKQGKIESVVKKSALSLHTTRANL